MHPSSQRVLMLEAPRRVRLAERPLAPPGPGDVVVRSRYSTFKHGTEMMAYRSETPHASRVFNPSLRLFENAPGEQSFYPRPLGSMVVGTVDWAGERTGELRPGDQVFGFAPIADVHAALEGSGSLTTLAMAIRAARQCGRIVCVGFYGPGTINLGEEFFHNRLTLLASLPALTWNNPVRGAKPLYAKALQEMAARDFAAGKITARGILSPTMAFRDAEQAVKLIADEPQ